LFFVTGFLQRDQTPSPPRCGLTYTTSLFQLYGSDREALKMSGYPLSQM